MKLGWMSDNPTTSTGFSTISKDLLNRLNLNPEFDCKYLAHNYIGLPLARGTKFLDGSTLDFELHGGGREQFCKDIMSSWVKEQKLDVFGILLDTFMVYPWLLQQDLSPAKTLFYFPSDGGGGLPLGCEEILRRVSCPVAMSRFAQRQAKELYNIDCAYIPHAVNTKLFYPLSAEEKVKNKELWGLKNKFVIGTVARNQGRKMLDRTIKAFYLFAQGKDDVVLLMHTDPQDAAQVFDIISLINRYKLNNKVLFTGTRYFKGFTYERMREVYNLMDVFFLSTSGEGFGIPTLEAGACGVPQAVTDCTTTHELLIEDGISGIPIPCLGSKEKELQQITGTWNVERYLMDIEEAAKVLQYYYDNPKVRVEHSLKGVEKARKVYDWDSVVIHQWEALLLRLQNV